MTRKIDIVQKWARKEDGGKLLGTAQLVLSGDFVATLGGKALGDDVVEYLLRFGFRQSVQNTYASADSFDVARKGVADKLAALRDGDVTSRGTGDPLAKYRRGIVVAALNNAKRADDKAAYNKVDAAKRTKWLDDYLAAAPEDFRAKVETLAKAALDAAIATAAAAAGIDDGEADSESK